jgi:hypothetical protein
MRKLTLAVGVAILATLGVVGRVDAQQFYPTTPTTPGRVDGGYGRASQYPTYPPQYPTTSRARENDSRHAQRDRDGDRDDDRRRSRNVNRRYDQRSGDDNRYGYGSTASSGAPSRVRDHASSTRSRSGYGVTHDTRWDREGR